MINDQNFTDFDMEIKNLLNNIEEMKSDIDLYSLIVDERVLVGV